MVLKLDAARWWKLDETFLDLLRRRTAIEAMLADAAGKEIADAHVSEPARVQNKIIHDCLEGEDRVEVEGFVPRYMRFPIGQCDP
ncbi:hypothetical protein J4G48_0027700 [Bradyrhizobium barranii subsp. apii]|nr:hypothetical protein [Bradyrhizobium barranii]UPT93184.1 hypothetical protein J4G48_0027700 [Bradyrhizobium barranii subsp. apii]